MDVRKLLTIGLVLGVVANLLDFIVHGNLLAGMYRTIPIFSPEQPIMWFVIGDFVAALVFTWVYLRFGGSAGAGPSGGAVFGFYAGVLVAFPANIFLSLIIREFPYYIAWIWTIVTVIWYVVLGAVAGAMNRR